MVGSRIALAEPVIGRAFARPVGSLVRDDEIDSIFKQPILRPSLRGEKRRSNPFFSLRGEMDCFAALAMTGSVAGLLAMTWNSRCASAFSRRDAPEVCKNRSRLDKQRAQGKPGGQCTRGLACEIDKAHERSHHRFTGVDPRKGEYKGKKYR